MGRKESKGVSMERKIFVLFFFFFWYTVKVTIKIQLIDSYPNMIKKIEKKCIHFYPNMINKIS